MGYDDEGLYIRSFRKVIVVNFLSAFTVATEVTIGATREGLWGLSPHPKKKTTRVAPPKKIFYLCNLLA